MAPEELRCVDYHPPQSALDALTGGATSRAYQKPDLASWLNLTTPRAYYLYTWLPSLLTNSTP